MWQELYEELGPQGFEVVTVGIVTAGAEACRSFIEAASPTHASLIDRHHVVAERFGVVNVPNGVWIDEQGMIVRPAETASAPRRERPAPATGDGEIPKHLLEIFGEAQHIQTDPESYEHALRDWVAKGADSEFALNADEVVARSRPRESDEALGQAHFELATHLEIAGDHDGAIRNFREAHRLVPGNFTYRRQAWSLEKAIDGPMERFWQGPAEGAEADWPYESDWLTDVRAKGAANYYEPWKA